MQHKDKERHKSESPMMSAMTPHDPFALADNQIINSAEIFSYKMKKEYDGSVYAAYCIHVSLQSGLKWIVERRYTQFRELRKEIVKIKPHVGEAAFPAKVWIFNLSKASLKGRQASLNTFLRELIAITPQLMEIGKHRSCCGSPD